MPDPSQSKQTRQLDVKEKKRSSFFKKISFFISAFGLSFIILLFLHSFFLIAHIEIHGTDSLYGVTPLKGEYLVLLDEEKIKAMLLAANPSVATIRLSKKLPSTLVIDVTKRKKIAILDVDMGYYYLSQDGVILGKDRKSAKLELFPHISYYQQFNLTEYAQGERLTMKDLEYALFFIKKVDEIGVLIDRLDIVSPRMLLLKTKSDKRLLFTTQKDRDTQVSEVILLIKKMTVEKREYKGIDVRFDKPVLLLK